MTDLPILFSPALLERIEEGVKTQTRRQVVPAFQRRLWRESGDPGPVAFRWRMGRDGRWRASGYRQPHLSDCPSRQGALEVGRTCECDLGFPMFALSPPAVVGGRLWVREIHALADESAYRAPRIVHPEGGVAAYFRSGWAGKGPPWRSPFHLPRWAARVWLRVESVSIGALQEITEADACAEGVPTRDRFGELWDSLHGRGGWQENPAVWTIRFQLDEVKVRCLPVRR